MSKSHGAADRTSCVPPPHGCVRLIDCVAGFPANSLAGHSVITERRMTPQVRLSEWNTLREELSRFGHTGDVTAADDRIYIDFGSAYVELSRDGTLKTGMPLHDFAHDDTVAVVVDHDAGTLTVEADTVSYTFRRPGG